jgi:uncharacterized protein
MAKNDRRCVSCRKLASKQGFWRIVRLAASNDPSHRVVLDHGMGRSAYLCPCADCLKAAQKKDRLSRALKAKIDPQIYQQLEARLDAHRENRIE